MVGGHAGGDTAADAVLPCLERQIGALLFERLAANRDKEQVLELARRGQQVSAPGEVIKDPFVLEFLDLRDTPTAHERDLEQAIIDRLEDFLLEMGKGFCFVARQKRLTLEAPKQAVVEGSAAPICVAPRACSLSSRRST